MTQVKEKRFVAHFEDMPQRIGREIVIDGNRIAVFRLLDDRVKAIGGVCPHTHGPLAEGIVSGEFVYCPLHEFKVSLLDGKVQEPDNGCVATYDTLVEDGQVFVIV
ncbi:MAG: nitrite reductase small subunit NirD [Candidatus Pristimantibacillus lignocellulolyticus]|uniref:Nitrite reductase small subunit NirD n=1 Tax=Candidatus Pristimantibacillus lignocellulolyticus TaxID=2994561 RepID=A0A9J6Z918_9BACL|nr:MAG: nitrite reductase small subunit NirD [Candidatus Pristimantibacillus lignocellulolyticus]